jgi:hypothetical protein
MRQVNVLSFRPVLANENSIWWTFGMISDDRVDRPDTNVIAVFPVPLPFLSESHLFDP